MIEITPKGGKIISIISNESGTEGFAYKALLLDALDRGATYTEVKEDTPEYDAFIDIGFEPDDDGVLVWKREKNDNESYIERYIRGGDAAILTGRVDEDAQRASDDFDGTDTEQLESREGFRLQGIGTVETQIYDKSLSSSAREIASRASRSSATQT